MATDYAWAAELVDGPGVDFGDGSSWARFVETYRDKNKPIKTQAVYDAAYATWQTTLATAAADKTAQQARIAAKKVAMKTAYNGKTYASLNSSQQAAFREAVILLLAEERGWLAADGTIIIPNGS